MSELRPDGYREELMGGGATMLYSRNPTNIVRKITLQFLVHYFLESKWIYN